jgi:hypothetical protein
VGIVVFQRSERWVVAASTGRDAAGRDLFERDVDCGIVGVMSHVLGAPVVNRLISLTGKAFV